MFVDCDYFPGPQPPALPGDYIQCRKNTSPMTFNPPASPEAEGGTVRYD